MIQEVKLQGINSSTQTLVDDCDHKAGKKNNLWLDGGSVFQESSKQLWDCGPWEASSQDWDIPVVTHLRAGSLVRPEVGTWVMSPEHLGSHWPQTKFLPLSLLLLTQLWREVQSLLWHHGRSCLDYDVRTKPMGVYNKHCHLKRQLVKHPTSWKGKGPFYP